MASTSAISGLVSGLDTKTIISQLMSIARAPQDELKTSLSKTNAQITAAQSINSKAASMTSLAKELAATKTYTTANATSTDSSVTTTAGATATSGSITFVVESTAKAHSIITGPLSAPDPANAKGYSFQFTPPGASTSVTVKAASDSAADIAKALSDSPTAKVNATVVNAGTSQRLQITAEETGSAKTFTSAGLPVDSNSADTLLEAAASAEIRVTGASYSQGYVSLSSETNTFTGVMTGVDVTVSKADPTKTITVSTAVNQSAISSKISSLVTAMNSVLADVDFHTKALQPGTTASATNGGLLRGNSTMRDLASQVLDSVSGGSAGSGTSATLAGLSVTRDGQVTFDSSAFTALYAKDPAQAAAVLQKFADAVQGAGSRASDPLIGSVSSLVTGSKSTVTILTASIADWDDRLAAKQKRLESQYAALEVALGKLSSQSDSLTSALKQFSND